MAKPILSIRRLLKTLVHQFIDAAKQGCRCCAVLSFSGVMDITDEDDIGVTVRPKHSAVREIVDAGIEAGSESVEDHAADYSIWIKVEVGDGN